MTEDVPCQDYCYTDVAAPPFCKDDDLGKVFRNICGEDGDGDDCLEFKSGVEDYVPCDSGELCVDGEGVCSPCKKVQCADLEYKGEVCVVSRYSDKCIGFDYAREGGDACGRFSDDYSFQCFNYKDLQWSGCSESPVCPTITIPGAGLSGIGAGSVPIDLEVPLHKIPDSEVPCICDDTAPVVEDEDEVCVDTTWTPARSTVCSGESFTQTSNCGNTRTKTGTKTCVPTCTVSSWTPATSTVCSGVSFTQTSNCDTTRTRVGTKNCTAKLSLDFSNVQYKWISPYHYYYHTRTFKETGGVGVTLTSAQLCDKAGCDPKEIVNYRIEKNNNLIHLNKRFWTPYNTESFTLKYWGADDNGNAIYVEQYMCVRGTSSYPNVLVC
ncbi:hypothetical protein [Desulfosudis oleivorans]|uniref:Uncharacterized protein n=1 Tax=Desulfosudis oleivorans (strain DSM 6200 / JCM 39069 / Hxd3) TaxID=96561 RepID=A8ZRV8_DESOH|nr:hypothetical protein [Desulfosudis oleivorans]ABW65875.1 hypothetical protein Dole_0065 [Desulfosudis oleivorans Hxd3]